MNTVHIITTILIVMIIISIAKMTSIFMNKGNNECFEMFCFLDSYDDRILWYDQTELILVDDLKAYIIHEENKILMSLKFN